MKERPILFSASMVRALLAGTKTQTRRAVSKATLFGKKDQESAGYRPTILDPNSVGNIKWQWANGLWFASYPHLLPYGQPGDRLWVRESWYELGRWERVSQPGQPWEGDAEWRGSGEMAFAADGPNPGNWRSRPSIHLPRKFSRITLEVTGIRVERLHDINEDDAKAEGVGGGFVVNGTFREDYRDLWESINGTGSWDANPWVWVVEFKVI